MESQKGRIGNNWSLDLYDAKEFCRRKSKQKKNLNLVLALNYWKTKNRSQREKDEAAEPGKRHAWLKRK
jgi:hypothetical protein